jgi:hypothetical protein
MKCGQISAINSFADIVTKCGTRFMRTAQRDSPNTNQVKYAHHVMRSNSKSMRRISMMAKN